MHTYGPKQLTSEELSWLTQQSRLLSDGAPVGVETGVLERRRAGGLASAIVLSLVVGLGALALIGWSLLQLTRSAHAVGPVMLMVFGAAAAAGLVALYWRGEVIFALARLPHAPMWLVTTEHLIRASGSGVTVWPIRDVAQVNVRMSRGGVSIDCAYQDGRRFYVSFGVAIYGGLTWPEGSSIAQAIQMAGGLPTTNSGSGLFASLPQDRGARGLGAFRRRALVAGAIAVVCIGSSFAYRSKRVAEARALMKSGALSSEIKHEGDDARGTPASGTRVASGATSGEPAVASADSGTRPPDVKSDSARATSAPVKRRKKPRATRAKTRTAKSSKRPAEPRTSGRLSRQIISRVVGRKRRDISACYKKGLAANPGLQGRVLVKLVIGSSGAVTRATDAGSRFPDRRVVSCIVGHLRTLRFPAPQGGSVAVVYPFDLRP